MKLKQNPIILIKRSFKELCSSSRLSGLRIFPFEFKNIQRDHKVRLRLNETLILQVNFYHSY